MAVVSGPVVIAGAYREETVTTKLDIAAMAVSSLMMPIISEAVVALDSEVGETSGWVEKVKEDTAAIPDTEAAAIGSRMLSTDSEAAAAPDSEVAVASGPGATAAAYWVEKVATNPDIGSLMLPTDSAATAAPDSEVAASTDSEAVAAPDSEVAASTDSEAAAAPDSELAASTDPEVVMISGPVVTAMTYSIAAVAAIGSLLSTDSEAAAAPDSEVAVVSGPVATAAAYWEEKVATNSDIAAVAAIGSLRLPTDLAAAAAPVSEVVVVSADSGARTDDAVRKAGENDLSRGSDWRENLSAMADYGPGDSHFLFLLLVVSWWPLLELSAAATLVILSGLVLWFDGTAYNFIRSGVEFRIYPSRLATPQWANRKTFQSVGRPFSRRRKLRVIMAGTGTSLPSRVSRQNIVMCYQKSCASLLQSIVSFLDCSHLLCKDSPACQASADEYGGDSTGPMTFGCSVTNGTTRGSRVGRFGIYQRICETSCHEYNMVPAHRPLRPGSPARQGARNE